MRATATKVAVDVNKLDECSLAQLEELYVDSLWQYYSEGKPLLKDDDFDKLKQQLYKRDSRFPTLNRSEVAFVMASLAYYRGSPVLSDKEYEDLKWEVSKSGRRKDVTAFLLYERGERLLDAEQFASMSDELQKIGLSAVNLDECTVAQLEEMYVDALWAYYKDGVKLLSDNQYDRLKQELSWQASGFPTLRREEVDFVKASLAYWRGEPLLSDEEWKELKKKVLADGKRKDVTAFLLYSKGQEVLDPDTFAQMKEEMGKLGVKVRRAGSRELDATLSVGSGVLENDMGQVTYMVSALGAIPMLFAVISVWAFGLFVDIEFVPDPSWSTLLSQEALPLFGIGFVFGLILIARQLEFLDLQNPQILTGSCPSCGDEIKIFSGGASPEKTVDHVCPCCGCQMQIDTELKRIKEAGLGAEIEPVAEGEANFNFGKAWGSVKQQVVKT